MTTPLLGGGGARTSYRLPLPPNPRLPALERQDTTFHGGTTTEDTHGGMGLQGGVGAIERLDLHQPLI